MSSRSVWIGFVLILIVAVMAARFHRRSMAKPAAFRVDRLGIFRVDFDRHLISRGDYKANPDVEKFASLPDEHGQVEYEAFLYYTGNQKGYTPEEIVSAMEADGVRPATRLVLEGFSEAFPDLLPKLEIAALGQKWQDSSGLIHVSQIRTVERGDHRVLGLWPWKGDFCKGEGPWNNSQGSWNNPEEGTRHHCFLAVRLVKRLN